MSKQRNTASCVTHTRHSFDDLDDTTTELWISQAQSVVSRLGWTYSEFDYAELVYATAVYLYMTSHLRKVRHQYPYYVVHCYEDDSRFETASFNVANGQFKRLIKDNKRVGVFLWRSAVSQEVMRVTADYPYQRDFGPQE